MGGTKTVWDWHRRANHSEANNQSARSWPRVSLLSCGWDPGTRASWVRHLVPWRGKSQKLQGLQVGARYFGRHAEGSMGVIRARLEVAKTG